MQLAQAADAAVLKARQLGQVHIDGRAEEGQALLHGALRVGQQPVDGAHPALERELAYGHHALKGLCGHLPQSDEQGQRDGQVERRAALAQVCRGQAHHYPALGGHLEARGLDGGAHAVLGLLDGRVDHTHDEHAGHAEADVDFDHDGRGLDPVQGAAAHVAAQHLSGSH